MLPSSRATCAFGDPGGADTRHLSAPARGRSPRLDGTDLMVSLSSSGRSVRLFAGLGEGGPRFEDGGISIPSTRDH